MSYYVYILESLKDKTYYVGSTNNLKDRIERHNQGRVSYTKPRRPWKLVYCEEHPDRSRAEFWCQTWNSELLLKPISESDRYQPWEEHGA